MTHDRRDPDALLALAQAEEERAHRGRLKIFLGAVAGVGKTYAMLEAAHELKRRGVDVVIGWVETHGRKETEALAAGLARLPPRTGEHRGLALREMDLDAALARHPVVLVVDELAHTNASGSRHAKRWQDVEELLGAGIDVYTTVNIQHLESLRDVVGQITGVVVRETVPDSILERADQVELVDLPAEDLLKRLAEGKVYLPAQAARAVESFFRPGNLIALRELALRKTAERVDEQMRRYREQHSIAATWPVAERLLVAVSSGPSAARLVRAARRLADSLHAEWWVVNVETPAELRAPEAERNRIHETLRLAESLGAQTAVISGQGAAEAILEYARWRNVTKIVVGKPVHPRWRDRLFGSVRDDLERRSGDIDVYVISGEEEPRAGEPARRNPAQEARWSDYTAALLVTSLATLLCAWMFSRFELTNLVMVYLLGVVAVAARGRRRAASLASVLSVLCFDFFFVPPRFSFAVSDTEYLVTFAVMLATALFISTLTVRLRRQADAARLRERHTAALYALSRDLVVAPDLEATLDTAARHLAGFFGCGVVLLVPGDGDRLRLAAQAGGQTMADLDIMEHAVAAWVFSHGQPAGRTTQTLPAAEGLYLPLQAPGKVVGVLGIVAGAADRLDSPDQLHLLETFANQIALAVE